MKEKFNGKAIYNPLGKAGEYAKWACNFYVGCSNNCSYCYCKKGILKNAMGMDHAQLKKCFKDENEAFEIYNKELKQNIDEIKKTGLFFTFTSDPFLQETIDLTWKAVALAYSIGVPCQLLTKRADFINKLDFGMLASSLELAHTDKISFGFSLTGDDSLEPNASSNEERIRAMKRLHSMGFKTFASIEPVIDISKSLEMIEQTIGFCDLYKIGLLSGKRDYDKKSLNFFVGRTCWLVSSRTESSKIYWKESVKKYLGSHIICARGVDANYNIFTDK